ncbi:MAG: beta-lactamase family protein [Flavobacteriaceae bacterium]|jgi:beta-lactamase class C|nr:beta-lactamase family protein [Flavobacteriaceae bacterium]
MQRFQILIKSSVLITALFFLNLSVVKSVTTPNKVVLISKNKIDKAFLNQNEIKTYKDQKQELRDALTAYFKRAITSGDIVGAGVSIVKGDSILISDGFGKRNIKLNDKVDGETVFRLGSISKGFAGVLAAKLKDEGVLNWNDKVSDYITEFKLGDSTNTNQITLATILSQTSGAPYHSYTNLIESGLSLTEIAKRFKALKPASKPGEMYSYQNAMFALSAEMMQKSTHQDVKTLLNDRFFKPLEMNSVSMDYQTLGKSNNVALPHFKSSNSWKALKLNDHYYNALAAGGINASALDMAKWMKLLLGHHPEIINNSALQEVFNPYIEIKNHNKYYEKWPGHVNSYYGFGWRIHKFLQNDEQTTILHHGGSVNSYRNEIAIYPDADLGICVLLNSNSKLAKTVIPEIYKIVNDVFSKTNSKTTLNKNALVSLMP